MKSFAEPIIEARELAYVYPGEESFGPALSGINLTICQGEHVALIGPNGSGKTTFLKLCNALLLPTGGEILFSGLSTVQEANITEVRRRCGMIFQNPDNQLVATTVEEDIAFGLENLALPSAEIRQRVNEVARLLHLDHLLQHPPHFLSGGEKQRVAIAGVLAMQPDCILMDEPTAMLDPAGRQDVLQTVKKLNSAEKLAIIHVTHFPEEAALADRVIVFNQGRLVSTGPPADILSDLTLLHHLGLESTTAGELAALLRQDGFDLPAKIINNRELVDSLCS